MQNVLERMEAIGAERKMADFNVKMKMDYEFKKNYAYIRAWEFYNECCARGLNCHVSVGGLDSITLFLFLRSIGIYVPGISVSHLEDRSIQEVHRQLGIERVQPLKRADGTVWNKAKIIQEFGFPVLSKEIASKIELLQNPSEKNKTVRHAIITGETGAYGGYQKNSRMKLSQKWLEKFGGYENETEGVNYGVPDFKVSAKCCYYLKEKPCDDWAKQHNSVPYLGLMASEGGRRAKSLKINRCNYFGKSTIRSAPFAIFNRQDILQLALELDVPVPSADSAANHEALHHQGTADRLQHVWVRDTHGKASAQIRPPAGAEREGMEILDVRYRLGACAGLYRCGMGNACGGTDEDRRGINEYRDFKRTDAGNGEEAGKHGLLSGTEGVL